MNTLMIKIAECDYMNKTNNSTKSVKNSDSYFFDEISRKYTLVFINGETKAKQEEFFKWKDSVVKIRKELTKKDMENRVLFLGLNPNNPDLCITNVFEKVFNMNRGSFEREQRAIRKELMFWYEIKEVKGDN